MKEKGGLRLRVSGTWSGKITVSQYQGPFLGRESRGDSDMLPVAKDFSSNKDPPLAFVGASGQMSKFFEQNLLLRTCREPVLSRFDL